MPQDARPVLNPVLNLKRDPRRASVTGREAPEEAVVVARLESQRRILSEQLGELDSRSSDVHAGRRLVAIRMFDDSFAPSWEPEALFHTNFGAPLVAPFRGGYVAELGTSAISSLRDKISSSSRREVRISVSRISSLLPITDEDILGGRGIERTWQLATEVSEGRLFDIWLAPFASSEARASVSASIEKLANAEHVSSVIDLVSITREAGSDADQLQLQDAPSSRSIARGTREYRQNPFVRIHIAVRDQSGLSALLSSGAVFRIDPVRPITSTQTRAAPDPERPVPDEQWHPIVGIVDGGLFARSYEQMIAWRAPSLVSDVAANRAHGNTVTSLVVHGSSWNTHLKLPELVCRVGIAQAIANVNQGSATCAEFESYLKATVERHSGSTKVWNLSFNQPIEPDAPHEMSSLGHELHKISRRFGILPIVSVGNTDHCSTMRTCPPADCEAALTVGGRIAAGDTPGEHCPTCLGGPGPEGLKKPEISWFSTLRALGGSTQTGSSFAAALVSSVAAHTFHNLRNATPDLVRALLLNTSDLEGYDERLGWGSPCVINEVPWKCPEGSVTLLWTAKLLARQWYYWEDIPIPPQLIVDGKLKGKVALTAILSPRTSELGSANYFANRLQVALQYTKADGKAGNLAGTMREATAPENEARRDYAKWNPVRHHSKEIKRGITFSGSTLRVCARVFERDLYQFDHAGLAEELPSDVAFAPTLTTSSTGSGSIYDSVATSLGNYVESAVTDIEIDIEL